MEHKEQPQKAKGLKIVIIILAVLLVLSAIGLAVRYIYLAYFARTQAAAKLELYRGQPSDNRQFEAGNILPGDVETKYFRVKIHHYKDIDFSFKADVTEQTKNLGDVLHIKVTRPETGKVLCDAPFEEINGKEFSELLKANDEKATTACYRIDVSLDTSAGNEYQAAMLKADFNWYVKDDDGLTPSHTGDNINLILWIVLAGSSFLLMLLLLLGRRRKKAERYD